MINCIVPENRTFGEWRTRIINILCGGRVTDEELPNQSIPERVRLEEGWRYGDEQEVNMGYDSRRAMLGMKR